MSDPVLDEKRILAILTNEDPQEGLDNTTCRLQAGALMAVLDAYDRKVDRDNFLLIMSQAVGLHSTASKRLLLDTIHKSFREEELTDAAFLVAEAQLNNMIKEKVKELAAFVTRLTQCANSGDAIN